jgi:hypothetical protein
MENEKIDNIDKENNRVKIYTVHKIFCLLLSVPPLYVIIFLPIKMKIFFPQAGQALMVVAFLALIIFVAIGLLLISKGKSQVEKLVAEGDIEGAVKVSKRSKRNYLNIMIVLWIVGVILSISLPNMINYAK